MVENIIYTGPSNQQVCIGGRKLVKLVNNKVSKVSKNGCIEPLTERLFRRYRHFLQTSRKQVAMGSLLGENGWIT
jgi:hypothetical protein